MKVNVYGLTDATISFNNINMMLRGKYSTNPEEFNPCSVAYNLELDNENQANELMSISKMGLIRIEVIDDSPKEKADIESIICQSDLSEKVQENDRRQPKKDENTKSAKSAKSKPDKAKVAEAKVADVPPSAADLTVPTSDKEEEENSRVVVMTETGPKGGKMIHKLNGEISEDDPRCKKAMEEAKRLKDEEDRMDDLIDDSLLDPSERMGSDVIVGTGSGKAAKVGMKNTVVGKKEEPNFIDLGFDDDDDDVEDAFLDDPTDPTDTKVDEDIDNAFIDLGNEEEDDLEEPFIEI